MVAGLEQFKIKRIPLLLESEVPLKTKTLYNEEFTITNETLEKMRKVFGDSALVVKASGIKKEDLKASPSPHLAERSLGYGGSVIVDYGGIGNLINAISHEEQKFLTTDIVCALIREGLVDREKRLLKMAASGAIINGRIVEIIDMLYVNARHKLFVPFTKASCFKDDGSMQIVTFRTNVKERVILENGFIVQPVKKKDSKAIFVRLNVPDGEPIDVYQLLAKAAQEAGLENYTVRGTVFGPLIVDIAVIKELPSKITESDFKSLVFCERFLDDGKNRFHFFGSRSNAASRQNDRWSEMTGEPVYSPRGHWHGYSENGQMGGAHKWVSSPKRISS